MSETDKKPYWWDTISKMLLGPVSKMLLTAAAAGISTWAAITKGDWEDSKVIDNLNLEQQLKREELIMIREAEEDSLRLLDRSEGLPDVWLELLEYRTNTVKIKSATTRSSLVRWFRSDHTKLPTIENYDVIQILNERTPGDSLALMPYFKDGQYISDRMPGTKEILKYTYNLSTLYIYDNTDTTASQRYPFVNDLKLWYYDETVEIHILIYLGETGDLKERWFLSVWMRKKDYIQMPKKMIKAVQSVADGVNYQLRLKKRKSYEKPF